MIKSSWPVWTFSIVIFFGYNVKIYHFLTEHLFIFFRFSISLGLLKYFKSFLFDLSGHVAILQIPYIYLL